MADSPNIRELYERYGAALYRRCRYFLRSDAAAEDALHDVFVKVVERYDDFQGNASPLTWMVRIATNHCLNLLRSERAGWRKRYQTTVETLSAHHGDPGRERFERYELLYAVLPKIPAPLRACAVYYYVDEMTQEQAAAAAGISVPTLRKRLRRFLALARREIAALDLDIAFEDPPP